MSSSDLSTASGVISTPFDFRRPSFRWYFAVLLVSFVICRPVAAQPFSFTYLAPSAPFVNYGDASFGDIDGDGRMDILALGNGRADPPFAPTMYQAFTGAEGLDDFSGLWQIEFAVAELPVGLWHGGVAWADYDGDGDLDALATGATNTSPPYVGATVLLVNDGGALAPSTQSLPGLFGSTASWADYDGDGDLDILLIGAESSSSFRTILLQNDAGEFAEAPINLPNLAYGDIAWTDIDADGDADVLLTGAQDDGRFVTDIFLNTDGTFAAADAGFSTPAFSSADWGDFDRDGDADLVLSGGRLSPVIFDGLLEVYRNNAGSFTRAYTLDPNFNGDARWGDYDADGFLDILAAGSETATDGRAVRLFKNQIDTAFVERTYLTGVSFASGVFSDYDGDLDPDVLVTGLDREGSTILGVYRNDVRVPNTAPTAPSGLSSSVIDGKTILRWDASVDEQSGTGAVTYNVRVGTSSGAGDVVSASTVAGGSRRLYSGRGNAGEARVMILDLPNGSYTWTVQAIDGSYAGSDFASEAQLNVTGKGSSTANEAGDLDDVFELGPAYPNPASGTISLNYSLHRGSGGATVTVYDALGSVVARETLNEANRSGTWSWSGRGAHGARLSSGIYFIQLTAGRDTAVRSAVLVR